MSSFYSLINRRILKFFNLVVFFFSITSATAQVQLNDFKPFKFQWEETFAPANAT